MNNCTGILGKMFGHKYEDYFVAIPINSPFPMQECKHKLLVTPKHLKDDKWLGRAFLKMEFLYKECKRCGRRVEDENTNSN